MARKRLTDEDRENQRKEALQRLEQATESLLTSDGWRAWLRTRSILHGYSTGNTLLLLGQAYEREMTLTHVAGFKAWTRLGRCVRKGETALRVFAPMPVRRREDEDQEEDSRVGRAEDGERRRMRYRLSSVFDVSQTDPLPDTDPSPLEPPRASVDGDSHGYLLAPMERFARELGYRVVRVEDLGGAEAQCDHGAKQIRLVNSYSLNHQLSALIHELGHALQGRQPREAYARNELIVESVAYIATQGIGLDTSAASVPYVAGWGGDNVLEAVRATVDEIDTLARQLQDALAGAHEADREAREVIAAAEAAGFAREPSMPDAYEQYLLQDAEEARAYLAARAPERATAA